MERREIIPHFLVLSIFLMYLNTGSIMEVDTRGCVSGNERSSKRAQWRNEREINTEMRAEAARTRSYFAEWSVRRARGERWKTGCRKQRSPTFSRQPRVKCFLLAWIRRQGWSLMPDVTSHSLHTLSSDSRLICAHLIPETWQPGRRANEANEQSEEGRCAAAEE